MGLDNSVTYKNDKEFQNFIKNYKIKGNNDTGNLDKSQIYTHKTNDKKINLSILKIHDKLEKELFEKYYNFVKKNNKYLIDIINYFRVKREALCINTEDIFIIYDCYENNINNYFLNSISLIQNKVEKWEFDMLLIIKSMLFIIDKASQENIFIYDIKPENIYINESKDTKFFHKIIIQNKNLQYFINKLFENEIFLYSPELLEEIGFVIKNNRSRMYKINWEKSSVFSLGVTVLSVLSKTKIKNYYDLQNYKFNNKMLQSSYNNIKLNYFSPLFLKIIKKMIEIRENDRFCSSNLLRLIDSNN